MPLDYYREAMTILPPPYLVFSDDLAWCRAHLPRELCVFVEHNRNYEDLFLMTMCDAHITAQLHLLVVGGVARWRPGGLPPELVPAAPGGAPRPRGVLPPGRDSPRGSPRAWRLTSPPSTWPTRPEPPCSSSGRGSWDGGSPPGRPTRATASRCSPDGHPSRRSPRRSTSSSATPVTRASSPGRWNPAPTSSGAQGRCCPPPRRPRTRPSTSRPCTSCWSSCATEAGQ